jgi:hypothetical protein
VKQTLWFSYKDIDKMPALMEAIKDEVKEACGEFLITDGSRPYRAHWRDFASDHLEVVVDVHFDIPHAGQAYWDNKQVCAFGKFCLYILGSLYSHFLCCCLV